MSSLSTNIALNFAANLQGTTLAGGVANYPLSIALSQILSAGTGSNKADQLFAKLYTAASGATYTGASIDLTSLGNDPIGNSLAMVTVKQLFILMRGNEACNYVSAVAIHAGGGGTGYSSSGTLTVAGGTGTAATISFTASGGVINSVTILTPGSYTANPTTSGNAATGGGGTGASLDLTMATQAAGAGVYVESDYISIGGDNTTNAWVSYFADKTDIAKVYSGNATNPGWMAFGGGGNVGYAINSTNKLLKVVNSGSNPLSFYLYLIGATA